MNSTMGTRRFGRVNWLGLYTLATREMRRFTAVWTQTLLAPLVTSLLFLMIFTLAVGQGRGDVWGVPFTHFLAPGLVMMAVVQNAFANTTSSIVISKVQGNIVDTLMPPLSAGELVIGFSVGGLARGIAVGLGVGLLFAVIVQPGLAHPLWALVFMVLGSLFMSAIGILAAVFANKFDQMAAITNFIVVPLSFLSGTFYSIEVLPPALEAISRFNPMFYLIDGFRYGVLGQSDASPWVGLGVSLLAVGLVMMLGWLWFRSGYRLKP